MSSQTTKRRKQVVAASFSVEDLPGSRVAGMLAGLVLLAAAALLAYVWHTNARAALVIESSSKVIRMASEAMQQGLSGYASGASEKMAESARLAETGSEGAARLGELASSPLVAPALRDASAAAAAAWSEFVASAAPVSSAIFAVDALSAELGKQAASAQRLVRFYESSAGQNAKAAAAAGRILVYAESGFGVASLPRVHADFQVLTSEASGAEARQMSRFVEPLMQMSASAMTKGWTREQAERLLNASNAASSAALLASKTSADSKAPFLAMIASALCALLGLAVAAWSVVSSLQEFGQRYMRAVQGFKGSESEKETLEQDLRALVESPMSASEVAVGEELGEIASLVNQLSMRYLRIKQESDRLIEDGVALSQQSSESMKAVTGLLEESCGILNDIKASALKLAQDARRSSLDAKAAVHAAMEASVKSSDAIRAAQDAGSRVDAMREGLQEASKVIKRLGERTQELSQAADSMDSFSEQISVLSLNTNLESERAGESGKGFRLIAREAQALARKSSEVSRGVLGLIQAAQADARSASELLDRATSQAVAGSNMGAAYRALLSPLASSMSGVSAMAKSMESSGDRSGEEMEKVAHRSAEVTKTLKSSISSQTTAIDMMAQATAKSRRAIDGVRGAR